MQAELAHECVVLSTHQPLDFMRQKEGGSAELISADEADLIQAVLTPSEELTDGFKFIVISGEAGVGKSHYISWINSQLKRSAQANSFHIVWIKKYDTLKTILFSILEPFTDLPEFSKIMADLEGAILNKKDNSGHAFQAGMNSAIDANLSEIKQELKNLTGESESNQKIRGLKKKAGFLIDLQNIFNEPDLRQHWTTSQRGEDKDQDKGVFSRILNQVIEGKTFENLEKEEHLFHSYDILDAFTDVDVTQLNQRVASFYIHKLTGSEGEKTLQFCIEILNDLVDQATQFAFQINDSLGGRSFQDLLNEIRKKLHMQNKELVFLIEDFVSMSGLQEQLLPTFVHGGRPEDGICKIRTVLAVTEDWFVGKSTYVQRKDDFIIKSAMDTEDEQVDLALNMVGAYLNASRYGIKKLSEYLEEIDGEVQEQWVPNFATEELEKNDQDIISAFGQSPKCGYSLFPFNERAIIDFLRRGTSNGQKLVFSPRGLVKNLILETISQSKFAFENSLFPEPNENSSQQQLPAQVEEILSDVASDESAKNRFRLLVKKWAHSDLNYISGPSFAKIAKAFGLEEITEKFVAKSGSAVRVTVTPDPIPNPGKIDPVPVPEPGKQKTPFKDLSKDEEEAIDQWNASKKLSQILANKLRKCIASSINEHINEIDKLELFGKNASEYIAKGDNIKIPNALGGKETAEIDVGNDKNGRLRIACRALLRAEKNIGDDIKYNYPKGQKDRADIIKFILPLKDKYVQFKREAFINNAQFARSVIKFIDAHEHLDISVCNPEQFDEVFHRKNRYQPIFKWAEGFSRHREEFKTIRSEAERVGYIYQGTGNKPIAKNPNIKIKDPKNIQLSKEYKNKYVQFFNYYTSPERAMAQIEALEKEIRGIAEEIKKFFGNRRPNFNSDKENFGNFLALLQGSRWPGEQFNVKELEKLFSYLEDLEINDIKPWENLKLTEIGQSKLAKGEGGLSLRRLIEVHLTSQHLSLFFEEVEKKNPYVPGSEDEETLLGLQNEVREELSNLENVILGV